MNVDAIEREEAARLLSRAMGTDAYPDVLERYSELSGVNVEQLHTEAMEWRERGAESDTIQLPWLDQFELTEGEMQEIEDQKFVVDGFIPEKHITVIVSRAGAGKTTIMFHLCRDIAHRGYTVVYIHSDTHPSEAKEFRQISMMTGVRYLTPDMKVGVTMAGALNRFHQAAENSEDLSRVVIVFDTLKKLTSVIHKGNMAALMRVLRKIQAAGATIVLLGHVNKHKSADGVDVYEGTGDLENDCDNLIYLIPHHDDNGAVVSTVCNPAEGQGKMRAPLKPLSWRILPDRTVERLSDYQDNQKLNAEEATREADAAYIEAVTAAIIADNHTQASIAAYCKEHYSQGNRQVRRTLDRWAGKIWSITKKDKYSNWHELM